MKRLHNIALCLSIFAGTQSTALGFSDILQPWTWRDQTIHRALITLNGIHFFASNYDDNKDLTFCNALSLASAYISLSTILGNRRHNNNPFIPGMHLMTGAASVYELYRAFARRK